MPVTVKGVVVGEAGAAATVGQDQFVTQGVVVFAGNIGSKYDVKDIIKPLAVTQFEGLVPAVPEVFDKA